jgi:hypothetical protein
MNALVVTAWPTREFQLVDGVVARVWNGVTIAGTPCLLLVIGVGVPESEDQEEFRNALKPLPLPHPEGEST